MPLWDINMQDIDMNMSEYLIVVMLLVCVWTGESHVLGNITISQVCNTDGA